MPRAHAPSMAVRGSCSRSEETATLTSRRRTPWKVAWLWTHGAGAPLSSACGGPAPVRFDVTCAAEAGDITVGAPSRRLDPPLGHLGGHQSGRGSILSGYSTRGHALLATARGHVLGSALTDLAVLIAGRDGTWSEPPIQANRQRQGLG